jgi:hypothetical protein
MRRQRLLRDPDQPQPTLFCGANQRIPKQNALRFVHAKMNGKNLLDAPIGHGTCDEHGAGRNFVLSFSLPFHGGSHLANRDPARRFDTALNHVSRRIRLQVFCGMIRLSRPLVLNKFNAAPVDNRQVAVTFADDYQGRPTGMSFQSESNLHRDLPFRPRIRNNLGATEDP